MKIQTLSIVIGTRACNAKCPFCVSRMTGFEEVKGVNEVNKTNLRKAILLAQHGSVSTILLTGKGEPTLYPEEISWYLKYFSMMEKEFPLIELQTNGLLLNDLNISGHLQTWYNLGLNTIAISTVGIDPELNSQIYRKDYPNLTANINMLHDIGFTVRLCVMGIKDGVDSYFKLQEVINFCRENNIAQLKFQGIREPESTQDFTVSKFVAKNGLNVVQEENILNSVERDGVKLMNLAHGVSIYDISGQNISMANCLTLNTDPEQMRSLIFYSNGLLTYDWQHKGAILLSGGKTPKENKLPIVAPTGNTTEHY